MLKIYPKNADIMTTYLSCYEIWLEEEKHEEGLKYAEECYDYASKYFDKYSKDNLTAVSILSKALYHAKQPAKSLEITKLQDEIGRNLFKSKIQK